MQRFYIILLWMLLPAGFAWGQQIRGSVINENGEPVEDAHIRLEGGDASTISGPEGEFVLNPGGAERNKEWILIVSRVGYESAEISIDNGKAMTPEKLRIVLKEAVYRSDTVVVTATRTRRDVEEVAIPVHVVPGEEIRRSGSMRLSDVLAEQTGMQIVNDHGTGIQVQGFDPDYTLIMIDGNPVIGRTAGTLDLTRISVQNVRQIEIVKGPSSALWGSDALAGVVNIITDRSMQPFSWGVTSRYGKNNTLDLSGNASFRIRHWNNDLFLNRNSSDGYRLNPASVARTVPVYENYTLGYQTELKLSDRISFQSSFRYFLENRDNHASIQTEQGPEQVLLADDGRKDVLIRPSFSYHPVDRMDVELSYMYSEYKTDSELTYRESGEIYERSQFNQYYHKPELQTGYRWNDRHHSVAGGGMIFERLIAGRYPDEPDFTTRFLFAQHSWQPLSDVLEVTAGVRFDTHSEYSSQVSPKFSARYRTSDRLQFRASVGRGFKAPEFRQLFLSFTNATAGYSVFGSSTVEEGIARLEREGNISQLLIPLETLSEIKAESSWAANAGFDLDLADPLHLRVNLFRNNVTDLIETAPVARLTNGQSVYTYFNLEDVYTQGIETELRWNATPGLQVSAGYQLLDARRLIEEERNEQNSEGEVVQRMFSSYEPMFNRSRHSGTIKLFYENEAGWGANIRGTLRGKYGLFDTNGNGFVDNNEYEDGYTLWNAAVSKRLFESFRLQAGVDNLLDYTNINTPNLPGRLWYARVSVQF